VIRRCAAFKNGTPILTSRKAFSQTVSKRLIELAFSFLQRMTPCSAALFLEPTAQILDTFADAFKPLIDFFGTCFYALRCAFTNRLDPFYVIN